MMISTLSFSTSSSSSTSTPFHNHHRPPPPQLQHTSSLASSSSSIFNPNSIISCKKASPLSLTVINRKKGFSCICLFGLGVPEMVVIAGVAVLLFGPKQLPEVGRSIGKTVKSFQQAAKEFETELKKEPDTISEQPPDQTTTTSVNKNDKQDDRVSSSKESS